MRIVYMGTPNFAVPALEKLAEAGVSIPLVITQPDKPKDRGKKLQAPPVKEVAEKLGIPVLQPESLRGNTELFEAIKACEPDLIVVAAYGRILPQEILSIPRGGCINLHGSLLPKYRGAAPIQRAVLEGAEETGVTLMYMSQGMDEGDMIAVVKTPVDKKTAGELFEELATAGAALLIENLPELIAGTAKREKQNENEATYAPMINKKDGLIDFGKSAEEIERQIRGMDPWPAAFTYYNGEPLKLLAAIANPNDVVSGAQAGEILSVDEKGIRIATGIGSLTVTKLQMAGKKAMEVFAYIKGNKIEIGTVLG
ncbi:MAG: methionyl-tRNA formyltransferase [Eubacteriales bacterium]|nr:methionyl-tRNA formyltransferase [Eubacteriales bacterium]